MGGGGGLCQRKSFISTACPRKDWYKVSSDVVGFEIKCTAFAVFPQHARAFVNSRIRGSLPREALYP